MTPCEEWPGKRDRDGYGWVQVGGAAGKKWRAHRYVWTEANGPIPEGLLVLHSCDNPPCVNLEHLWLGTSADNARDRDAKGRGKAGMNELAKTHCPAGHPYDAENTYVPPGRKARHCRTCMQQRSKARTR